MDRGGGGGGGGGGVDRGGGDVLLAFDFDHTIVDANSDVMVCQLAPDGTIPDEIQATYRHDDWTQYMGEIFKVHYTM